MLLKLNSSGEDVKTLQTKLGLYPDGTFGPDTQNAVKKWQTQNDLDPDGVVGNDTWSKMFPIENTSKLLSEQDYIDCASTLGIEEAAIKAVSDVESSGNGFLSDGTCKILYEPYTFSSLTKHIFDSHGVIINNITYPLSLSGKWDSKICNYGPYNIQWNKLNEAIKLDKINAIKSCSWSKFQIMGYNYQTCGYKDVITYMNDMQISEKYHLNSFMNFIKSNQNMFQSLKNKNWSLFAEKYNGPSYKQNNYDSKLLESYNKYSKI